MGCFGCVDGVSVGGDGGSVCGLVWVVRVVWVV